MKKFMIILLAFVLVVTIFAACGGKDGDVTSEPTTTGTTDANTSGTEADGVKFDVVFDLNYAGADDAIVVAVDEGEKVAEPADPTRIGYTFTAWFVGEDRFDFDTVITAALTLTAGWELNVYNVVFSTDDSVAVIEQVNHGDKVARPADPTRTGYTFTGWFVGGEVFDFDTAITAAITLTAGWELNAYTVTFDSDGGSAVADAQVNHGGKAAKPVDPTRVGFRFDGWFTAAADGDEFDFETAITADVTLFAQWTQGIVVTWNYGFAEDGIQKIDSSFIETDVAIILTDPIDPDALDTLRPGYIFIAWTVSGEAWDFEDEVDADITLVATWEEIIIPPEPTEFIITFDLNGAQGELPALQVIRAGGAGFTSTEPTGSFTSPVGLPFIGWSTVAEGPGELWDFDAVVTENVTLYARFITSTAIPATHSGADGFYEIVSGPRYQPYHGQRRDENEGLPMIFLPSDHYKMFTQSTEPIIFKTAFPTSVTDYVIRSANDNTNFGRHLRDWTFAGSVDGVTWVTLHTVTGAPDFTANHTDHRFTLPDGASYYFNYFRLHITGFSAGIQIGQFRLEGTYAKDGDDYFIPNFYYFSQDRRPGIWDDQTIGGVSNSLFLSIQFNRYLPMTSQIFDLAANQNPDNNQITFLPGLRWEITNGIDTFDFSDNSRAFLHHHRGADTLTYGPIIEIRFRMDVGDIPIFIPHGSVTLYGPDGKALFTTGMICFSYYANANRMMQRFNANPSFFPAVLGDLSVHLEPTDWFGPRPDGGGHGVSFIEHLAGHDGRDGSDPKLAIAWHGGNFIRNFYMSSDTHTADPGNGLIPTPFMRFFIIVEGVEYEFIRINNIHSQGLLMKINSVAGFDTPDFFTIPPRPTGGTGNYFFYDLEFRAADGVTVLGYAYNMAAYLR